MTRGRLVLVLLGLAAGIVATALLLNWRRQQDAVHLQKLEARFGQGDGDPNGLKLIRDAQTVHAQRMRQERYVSDRDFRQNYDPEGDAFEIDPTSREQLKALLASPRSYDWGDYAKGCATDFGIKLTFVRDDNRIDVWLCLSCSIMFIVRADGSTVGAHFDPSTEEMIAIAKRLFPNDPDIAEFRMPDLDAKRTEPAK